ncbi:MAG: hypothetical protein OEX22_06045 [Cyclobacteriaceae bacterium]|nr:hypothetical protein [Cyclobacteriaceae bacterium]
MEDINLLEQDAFIEIASIGLSKSADSLSQIINEKVLLKTTKMGISIRERLEKSDTNDFTVLTTRIMGEHEGICILIFSQEDALNIQKKCLPGSEEKEMREALLLEIDNIISASVITQLANILDLKIYGDVPQITSLNLEELKQHLYDLKIEFKPLLFSTNLISENLKIQPDFFWYFKDDMLKTLKEFVNKEN